MSGTNTSRKAGLRRWATANWVPLVLIPLGVMLLWAALWQVWLPPVGGAGTVSRVVTTVDANAPTRPTHRVTTVVRQSRAGTPSRRSELLALALVFLGAGAIVVAVFHDRIGTLELGKDGLKLDLTPAEAHGAAALVGRLARKGAGASLYARGIDRYLRAVGERHTDTAGEGTEPGVTGEVTGTRVRRGASGPGGLTADEASALAGRIADDLV